MKHIKQIFLIFIIFFPVVLLNSCKKEIEKTVLLLYVSKNPDAGSLNSEQTAEISGKILGFVKEIDVVIEWYWEDRYHENLKLLSNETVVFNSYEEMSITTQIELLDHEFLSYYWIEVSWQDDDGSHMLESGKAYCVFDYR